MTQKESEDSSIDYKFISKYIRDDSNEDKENLKKDNQGHFLEKFETKKSGPVEVLGSVGEGESYSENTNFNKRQNEENEGFEKSNSNEKVEFTSKPLTDAKREFLKHLEDESLSIDTCSNINRDWKRK